MNGDRGIGKNYKAWNSTKGKGVGWKMCRNSSRPAVEQGLWKYMCREGGRRPKNRCRSTVESLFHAVSLPFVSVMG
jgi:hypothetical protein